MRYIIENANKDVLEKLSKKIHIHVANDDSYFLDLGVKGFKEVTDKSGLEVDIHFYDAMGHDVWNDSLRNKIHLQIR